MNNNIMNMLTNIMRNGNPQMMVNNMIQNNPQLSYFMKQMNSKGMTPEQFIKQYSQQNNIDINPYIQMLQNMGIRFK